MQFNPRWEEIKQDMFPNLSRPPHDYLPPSSYKSKRTMYSVQTWDEDNKQVRYRDVTDAIDYEDAEDYITHLYPNEKVIAVVRYLNESNNEYDDD